MSAGLVSLKVLDVPWANRGDSIVIGKDILDILSSAMYVDPLTIYREYVQNSADSIDEARRSGILGPADTGLVSIDLDYTTRTARIRDNGTGVPAAEFEARMTAFGASCKRGTNVRGFRGVGRISGLGYCQELLFRSRYANEPVVSELRWDCRKAKTLLRSADFSGDLASVVSQSVQVRRIDGKNWPEHFFEVELRGLSRLRNDWLLNPAVIEEYLSQVAPLPFAPEFRFSNEIASLLRDHLGPGEVSLAISGNHGSTFRPHRDSFTVTGGDDHFSELQQVNLPGTDGGTAAIGWILHHGYRGAVQNGNVKGLRLRSGNIQVGGSGILEDLFAETRFNSWCVGEIHVIDRRIIPNGRRDHFEQNVHYTNLINQLSPIAREISSRCRQSSIRRNWLRDFERKQAQATRDLGIIRQGSLSAPERQLFATQVQQTFGTMEKIIGKDSLRTDTPRLLHALDKLRRDFAKLNAVNYRAKALAKLAPAKRRTYEQVFALLYECSTDKAAARLLVDRMLARLARSKTKTKE